MNRLLAFTLALLAAGCTGDKQRQEGTPAASAATPAGARGEAVNRQFEQTLLEIAGTYESFCVLGTGPRWAPVACAPFAVPSVHPRFSDSGDPGTHGYKMYWVFAKEVPPGSARGYIPAGRPNPVGQAIVKEAWTPEEAEEGSQWVPPSRVVTIRTPDGKASGEKSLSTYTRRDEKLYHAKEKAGLFIMYKLDPKTPGTDEGWVYGTVTADGKRVTSAGRVESCMGCHRDAPHDRLFGLPKED